MLKGNRGANDGGGEGSAAGAGGRDDEHVYKILVVRGIPFYGYSPKEKYYMKVSAQASLKNMSS
jgi:hypothetical protein